MTDVAVADLGSPSTPDGAADATADGAGDQSPREALRYRGDRLHHLRFGFTVDILGETEVKWC